MSPAVALSRALTEAAQSRLTSIAGSRDDITGEDYRHRDEEDLRELEELIIQSRPSVCFDRRSLATETVGGDLDVLLEQVRLVGVESLVAVDLTRPQIGIPVVKVIATQLEGPYGAAANSRLKARSEPSRS